MFCFKLYFFKQNVFASKNKRDAEKKAILAWLINWEEVINDSPEKVKKVCNAVTYLPLKSYSAFI